MENRMLLAREIVRGIRQKCGSHFPIAYTHCEDDFKPGGIKPEEAIAFAKALEMDSLSFLDLQVTGTFETFHLKESPGSLRRQTKGQFDRTVKYKKALHIPVTTRACSEYDPVVIDDALDQGAADMIFIGRQMLADPEYPNKVLEGRLEDIRPCITSKKGLAKDVTLVEMLELAHGMNPLELLHMFTQVVPKIGLKMFAHTRVEEITDKAVVAMVKDWQRHEFEADTVVLALGYCSDKGIYERLKGKVPALYLIGDAREPKKIENAIWEGRFIASQI